MADLKTYLGISDTDIKSVSGLPADDIKTILGSLLNQSDPPDAAPTGLILTVIDRTDIKLDWTDNATNEDGYKIERSLNGVDFTVIDTVAADTETYTDEGLDELTQYYYRVRAYKGEEYSDYTDIENETTSSPAFIITVDTTKAGSASDTFVLRTTGAGYDAYVDWGDGSELQNITGTPGNVTHQYTSPGTYQIKITGTFPRIYFANGGDKLKLIYIDNWGDIAWGSMNFAFSGCSNMQGNWSDIPDLSSVTDLSNMFGVCSIFNYQLNDWDVSNITNLYLTFSSTSFNQPLNNWDVRNVKDFRNTFMSSSFNQSLSNWDTRSAITMYGMFQYNSAFNQSIDNFDTGLVENMAYMFKSMPLKQSLASFDISSCTDLTEILRFSNINETGTTTNYDATLISWAAQTVNSGLSPHFGTSKYGQGKVDEGTTDGTTADKLVDSTQNFLTTVTVGDVIHNTTDGTYARVTAVDSDTTLSLDTDIMVSGEAYVIQHSDAAKARASLILDDGWTITDGGAA